MLQSVQKKFNNLKQITQKTLSFLLMSFWLFMSFTLVPASVNAEYLEYSNVNHFGAHKEIRSANTPKETFIAAFLIAEESEEDIDEDEHSDEDHFLELNQLIHESSRILDDRSLNHVYTFLHRHSLQPVPAYIMLHCWKFHLI